MSRVRAATLKTPKGMASRIMRVITATAMVRPTRITTPQRIMPAAMTMGITMEPATEMGMAVAPLMTPGMAIGRTLAVMMILLDLRLRL
jgi:hypothetical protein